MYDDFDDAKEESNKAATFVSRLIQDCFNKQSLDSRFLQDQALPQQRVSKSCKALVIDLPEGKFEKLLLKRVLNLNFEHVIDYHMSVIDYQQQNSLNSNSKVMTLQNITV